MALARLTNEDRDTILALHGQGYTQADIIRHFRQEYGVDIPRSTLSDFLKGQPRPGRLTLDRDDVEEETPLPPRERAASPGAAQLAAVTDVYKATTEEMIDKVTQVIEGVQQIKREGETHYQALHGKIDTVSKRLRGEVPRSTLRRVWVRTFVAWGLLGLLVCAWQPAGVSTAALWIGRQSTIASTWAWNTGDVAWSTVSEWIWGPPPAKPARKAVR